MKSIGFFIEACALDMGGTQEIAVVLILVLILQLILFELHPLINISVKKKLNLCRIKLSFPLKI